jgi:hypothetical protein
MNTGTTIGVGVEQTLGSEALMMQPLVAQRRFIDRRDDNRDGPHGIPAPDEEEIEPSISESAKPQTRHCGKLERLLGTDVQNLMQQQIFQNHYLTAETFPKELTENWDYVTCHLFE